jgi:hypothetical protein
MARLEAHYHTFFRELWQPNDRSLLLFPGDLLMPVRQLQFAVLILVVLSGLMGCSGNYKFNDAAYRPLGDPQAFNRGK